MGRITFFALVIVWIVAGVGAGAQQADVKYLPPEDFWNSYQSEAFAILSDVRISREYRRERLPQSINIPNIKKLELFADTLDREIPVYIYCDGESRSITVMKYLKEKEFITLVILKGGFTEWKAYEMPVLSRKGNIKH